MSKSTEELREKLTIWYANIMWAGKTLEEVSKQHESTLASGEKRIDELMKLFDQELAKAKMEVIEWLEKDLKRLDERNWTMEALALDTLVACGKADDYQKGKRQQIVDDRRAAHALYAILSNYKATLNNQTKESR